MTRRLLVLVVALATLFTLAAPAGAAGSFDPPARVLRAGCDVRGFTGDAVAGPGATTVGFVAFTGPACNDRIRYFSGAGDSWSSTTTRYRGRVLAVTRDASSTYLLSADDNGIYVSRRGDDGTESRPRRVSRRGLGAAIYPTGDLVAAGGRWLAVWSEQVGPGGEFAQSELFSARTLGSGHCFDGMLRRHRITNSRRDDIAPTLAMIGAGSGAGVQMFWERNDGARGLRSDLHRGTLDLAACDNAWTSGAFVTAGRLNIQPDLQVHGQTSYLSWWRDGRILTADDRSGSLVAEVSGRRALTGPKVSASGGRAFSAWTAGEERPRVVLGKREGGTWTRAQASRTAASAQVLLGLGSSRGKATVLVVDFGRDRLYARTQS